MNTLYYIGLDIHKRTISYCIKAIDGRLAGRGKVDADRTSLCEWAEGLPGPWIEAMEATIFTGWVYDFLKPYAVDLKVAHPEILKAITVAKKKNDRGIPGTQWNFNRLEKVIMSTEYTMLRKIQSELIILDDSKCLYCPLSQPP